MRQLLLVALAALMAVAGCSNSQSAAETPSPAQPATSATTSNPTLTTPAPAAPAADCLDGRYRLVRFIGVGDKGTFGTGEGGDVAVTFDNGPTCFAAQAKTLSNSRWQGSLPICWWTAASAVTIG